MTFNHKSTYNATIQGPFKNGAKRGASILLPLMLSLALPFCFTGRVVAENSETAKNSQGDTEQRNTSVLTIKNDDTAEIDVFIEPGEGTLLSSSPHIKRVVEPGKEITINVTKKDLGDVDTFSVKGTVLVPSLYNRSSGLFFGTNYRVVFVASKLGGTVCHVDKITSKGKEKVQ